MPEYPDIWSFDVATPAEKGPQAILAAQGEYLSKKTGDRVRGEVEVRTAGARLRVVFFLYARAIDYWYKLLEVVYLPSNPYPLQMLFYDEDITADDERDFLNKLGLALIDDRTRTTIQELLAATSRGQEEPVAAA